MSDYTVERLREDRPRCLMSKELARKHITEVRDLFDRLLDTTITDAERVRITNKISRRMNYGYSRIEHYAVSSKILAETELSVKKE